MQCNLWWRDQCAEFDSHIQSKICVEKIKVKAATAVSFSLKKFNMSDNFFFFHFKVRLFAKWCEAAVSSGRNIRSIFTLAAHPQGPESILEAHVIPAEIIPGAESNL